MPDEALGVPGGAQPSPDASSKVAGPAIALIVVACLGLALNLLGIILNLAGVGLGAAAGGQAGGMQMLSGTIGVVLGIISIIGGVVVLMGALRMKNLKSHTFAMVSSVIAMIPFISPCCILGIPFGIWALVVLLKPEVKAAFTD